MSGDDRDDLIGQGGGEGGGRFSLPQWRLSRGSAVLAAVTLAAGLLAGLAAGYTAGERHAASSAGPLRQPASAPPASSASAGSASAGSASPGSALAVVSPALIQLTAGCSAQIGGNLQLGVPVTNQSAAAVTLGEVKAVMPLGGLRAISKQWGPCGALPAGQASPVGPLAPGDSAWFTVTFKVLVKCPGPLPVQFTIGYDVGSQHAVAALPGFPDLSQVPYKGCPAATGMR